MTTSQPDSDVKSSQSRSGATRLWLLVVVVAALLPSLGLLSALALVIVTNSLDPAFALGVSDAFMNGLLVASSGLLTGLFAALLVKCRGWVLVVPPMAGLFVGLGIFLAIAASGSGERFDNHLGLLATVWIGQAAAIILATRVAGLTLAGAVGVLVVVGVGVAAVIQAIPETPAEVLLILEDYTYDDPPGRECWGTGEFSQVVEGSRMLLLESSEALSGRPTEVGAVVLPAGTEGEGGCVFELGNPLGGTAVEYANIDFHHESDPNAGIGMSVEGNHVIITLGDVE